MRIVAGDFGGRRLKAVPGMKTRPTTDKIKESMFNIIGPYFDGGKVLDLYAGSGGLAIEAVSRGAEHATLVDRQYQAIKTIKENVEVTKKEDAFSVIKGDAKKIIVQLSKEKKQFDYVFFDPPYKQQDIMNMMQKLLDLKLLNSKALIICETDQEAKLPEKVANFTFLKRVDYGITELTFYVFEGSN